MTSYDPEAAGMKKSWIGWLVAAGLAFGGAVLAWVFWFAGGSGEPSTELTTPDMTTTTSVATDITEPEDTAESTEAGASSPSAFVIDPTQSIAAFEIDEVLRGEPKTVLGTTSQVAGQVLVDPDDLSASVFSDILINARSFTTDAAQRDRAIRGPVILNSASDQHELITFSPSSIEGLDARDAVPGEEFEFTVTGDLTIRDTTGTVSFQVTVGVVDESTLQGMAIAFVLRSDFGIGIPSVAFVADVSDEVTLYLDFVAVAG